MLMAGFYTRWAALALFFYTMAHFPRLLGGARSDGAD
jgi:hypothetical protein